MKRPLILAHRGASAYAPENTLAAFHMARELGADGLEFDVHFSREGIPVVIHDSTVDRTTGGRGKVSRLTIGELRQLDAGAWKGTQFTGERIPSLQEVFETLGDWIKPSGREQPCILNLELKSEQLDDTRLKLYLNNLIARYDLHDRLLISSFSPVALHRVKKMNPRLRRGLLYDRSQPIYLRRAWLRFYASAQALHPEHAMIDERYMKWARGKKYAVNTWTVDDPDEARRLASLGVHAIITNQPDLIRAALEK